MREEQQLEALKEKMSSSQRRDMAELLANELKRRGLEEKGGKKKSVAKSGAGMKAEDMADIYANVKDRISIARRNKLAALAPASARQPVRSGLSTKWLMVALLALVGVKLGLSLQEGKSPAAEAKGSGSAQAAVQGRARDGRAMLRSTPADERSASTVRSTKSAAQAAAVDAADMPKDATDPIFLALDKRRAELDARASDIDTREGELKKQQQALEERFVELQTLLARLTQVRKEHEGEQDARLEQLASVYGTMAPQEAAPLIAKLDDETALSLLERMPGKRMGQILSVMDQQRAVELTKILSVKNVPVSKRAE